MNLYTANWSKYAQFSGRSGRGECWAFIIVNCLIFVVLEILGGWEFTASLANMNASAADGGEAPEAGMNIFYWLVVLWSLINFIPSFAVYARRLHDSNKTGWLSLVLLIPCIGTLALIILLLLPGTPGDNKYGAPASA